MEILNSYPIFEARNFTLCTIFLILAIVGPLITCCISEDRCHSVIGKVILITLVFIVFLLPTIYYAQNEPTGITEYQVILSDDYSANELYKKYDVIKTEGKIWYIQDKEKSNEDADDK